MKTYRSGLMLALALASVTNLSAAITVQFDYSYDQQAGGAHFFDDAGRRALLQKAADDVTSRFGDNLLSVQDNDIGNPNNCWYAWFWDPNQANWDYGTNPTGYQYKDHMVVDANVIKVFVGAAALAPTVFGHTLAGDYTVSPGADASYENLIKARGQTGALLATPTDFGPWGGSLSFNSTTSWHFDADADPMTKEVFIGQMDFYSVAVHELTHLLGVGTSPSWYASLNPAQTQFTGPVSGTVPLEPGDPQHFQSSYPSVTVCSGTIQEAAMDPGIGSDTRKYLTQVDLNALDDIGWQLTPVPEPQTYGMIAGLMLLGWATVRKQKA